MSDDIFVQIASYRDPELLLTVRNAKLMAAKPDRLKFGIVEQVADGDDCGPWSRIDNVQRQILSTHGVAGVGQARCLANAMYGGEKYYLQIDAHTRFSKNWDQTLIDQLEDLLGTNDKPLLTAYPNMYVHDPETRLDTYMPKAATTTVATGWHQNGLPILEPRLTTLNAPVPAITVAAGFVFAFGEFASVPKDPEILFLGEEVVLAAQCFTRGYDMLHPRDLPIFHHYTRDKAAKPWLDSVGWGQLNDMSMERVCKLLASGDETYFGSVRTFKEYEKYCGIDFSSRTIK